MRIKCGTNEVVWVNYEPSLKEISDHVINLYALEREDGRSDFTITIERNERGISKRLI